MTWLMEAIQDAAQSKLYFLMIRISEEADGVLGVSVLPLVGIR